jgi:hypothetical protein
VLERFRIKKRQGGDNCSESSPSTVDISFLEDELNFIGEKQA